MVSDKERIKYYDIVKGIGIIAVVLGHVIGEVPYRYGVDLNESNLYIFLFSFHVPVFFIVSGMLLQLNNKKESIKSFVIRKCKSYLWPYITFSIIAIITRVIFKVVFKETDVVSFLVKTSVKTIIGEGFLTLWFIPTLLFAEVLFCLMQRINKRVKVVVDIVVLLLCSTVSILLKKEVFNIPKTIEEIIAIICRVLIAYIFIVIGYLISKLDVNSIIIALLGLVIIVANYFLCRTNGNVDIKEAVMGNNVLLFWYFSLSTSLAIIFVSKIIIKECIPLEYLGKNSLIIMATHFPIPMLETLKKNSWSIPYQLNLLFMFIIVMLVELLIIFVINKYGKAILSFDEVKRVFVKKEYNNR